MPIRHIDWQSSPIDDRPSFVFFDEWQKDKRIDPELALFERKVLPS